MIQKREKFGLPRNGLKNANFRDCFRYTSDLPLDLGFVYRQTDSRTPVLLLYDEESSVLETLVKDLAGKKQVTVLHTLVYLYVYYFKNHHVVLFFISPYHTPNHVENTSNIISCIVQ
jgi:hypothetical protein